MSKIQKVLVTGGKGFVGTHVVRELLAAGYTVKSVSRRDGVDLLDFNQTLALMRAEPIDLVVHCAADVGGIAYSQKFPAAIYENNLIMGFNTLRACREAGIENFLNVMPNCVYPGHLDLYREEDFWNGAIHPSVLPYGLPRKALWVQSKVYTQQYNIKSVHLVFPNMYGPGDHMDPVRSHALGAMIQKIVDAKKSGKPSVEIWGTGKPIREWMFVKDAAKSILKTLQCFDLIHDDLLNVGVGKGISVIDMAHLVAKHVGYAGDFTFNTTYPDGALEKKLAAEKFTHLTGWSPATNLDEGIRETIEWYLKQPS